MPKPGVYNPDMVNEAMTAQQFKAIREQAGMTQEAFAEVIGYHPKSITRYESGRKAIGPWLASHVLALFRRGRVVQLKPEVGQTAKKRKK